MELTILMFYTCILVFVGLFLFNDKIRNSILNANIQNKQDYGVSEIRPGPIESDLMTNEEIIQKYSGVTCKMTLIKNPSVIYNIDEKRVVSYPDTFEVIPASEGKDGKIRIKPGNRRANVKTYDRLDLKDINNSEEILVYIQKTPANRWRYIKVEDIETTSPEWVEGEMYLCYDILIEDWVVGYSKETPGKFRRPGYNPKETYVYEKYKKVKE